MSIAWYRRLGGQLLLASFVLLLMITAAVAAIMLIGFEYTEAQAVQQSGAELERQASEQLTLSAEQEAQVLSRVLEHHASLTRQGADLLQSAMLETLAATIVDPPLTETPEGKRFDADPERGSDIVIFNYIPDTAELREDIHTSLVLNAVFPGMLKEASAAGAIYYISEQGIIRYYPPLGLHDALEADFTILDDVYVTVATPENNPERKTRWTPPYIDPGGLGLLVSGISPIYDGDTFEGVVGIDISLTQMISRLAELDAARNMRVLLLDADANLIAASPGTFALLGLSETASLTDTFGQRMLPPDTLAARAFTDALGTRTPGSLRLHWGTHELLAVHAPIEDPAWSLVFLMPAEQITATAQQIGSGIDRGARETLMVALGALGLLAVLSLLGMYALSRRLSSPLQALLSGTTAIAQRRYDVSLPVSGSGEFSALAASFNQMTATVRDSQAQLQQLNQDLERTVQERTASLEQERATLQQTLDELRQMSTVVAQLNTPIMPVLPGVLVIPLIGVLSPERVQALRAEMAEMASAANARTVILDLTGVTALDGDASESFLRGLQSLRLLGAEALLVGINPDVAQHLVQTGDLLRSVPTLPNLAAAVEHVLRKR